MTSYQQTLDLKYQHLPQGVRIVSMGRNGFYVSDHQGTRCLNEHSSEWHQFISAHNLAHYFIGTPSTNASNPSNATVKISTTPGRGYFNPHAHKSSHIVSPFGPAGCLVYNDATETGQFLNLDVGQIIIIDPMVVHSFYNRSTHVLGCLIANTGLGINAEGYAITQEIALKLKKIHPKLVGKLDQLQQDIDTTLASQWLNAEHSTELLLSAYHKLTNLQE